MSMLVAGLEKEESGGDLTSFDREQGLLLLAEDCCYCNENKLVREKGLRPTMAASRTREEENEDERESRLGHTRNGENQCLAKTKVVLDRCHWMMDLGIVETMLGKPISTVVLRLLGEDDGSLPVLHDVGGSRRGDGARQMSILKC